MRKIKILSFLILSISFLLMSLSFSNAETVKKFTVNGNDRISDETIIIFSSIKQGDKINSQKLNKILKNLYDTNFFDNISVNFKNNELIISVIENPIINKIKFTGIKSKTLTKTISKNLNLKSS